MTTLTLKQPLGDVRTVRVERIQPGKHHPFVDYGRRFDPGGEQKRCKEPPRAPRVVLTLQALQRHNTLTPVLQPTDRVLCRWGESEGAGLPAGDADIRETHYTPLPPDLQTKVSAIVTGSPWELFTRKWYRTDLTVKALAEVLCVSRAQLYVDWKSALWYFYGRFEAVNLHE